jgi:hypothetical protein
MLLTEGKEDVIKLMKGVKNGSEKAGLKLNVKKTGVLSMVEQVHTFVGGE